TKAQQEAIKKALDEAEKAEDEKRKNRAKRLEEQALEIINKAGGFENLDSDQKKQVLGIARNIKTLTGTASAKLTSKGASVSEVGGDKNLSPEEKAKELKKLVEDPKNKELLRKANDKNAQLSSSEVSDLENIDQQARNLGQGEGLISRKVIQDKFAETFNKDNKIAPTELETKKSAKITENSGILTEVLGNEAKRFRDAAKLFDKESGKTSLEDLLDKEKSGKISKLEKEQLNAIKGKIESLTGGEVKKEDITKDSFKDIRNSLENISKFDTNKIVKIEKLVKEAKNLKEASKLLKDNVELFKKVSEGKELKDLLPEEKTKIEKYQTLTGETVTKDSLKGGVDKKASELNNKADSKVEKAENLSNQRIGTLKQEAKDLTEAAKLLKDNAPVFEKAAKGQTLSGDEKAKVEKYEKLTGEKVSDTIKSGLDKRVTELESAANQKKGTAVKDTAEGSKLREAAILLKNDAAVFEKAAKGETLSVDEKTKVETYEKLTGE
ncbi:MAG: hypothetical protein AAB131_21380, partial [Actinomycetota bacterium]